MAFRVDFPLPIGEQVRFRDGPYPGGKFRIIDAKVIGYQLTETGKRMVLRDADNVAHFISLDEIERFIVK